MNQASISLALRKIPLFENLHDKELEQIYHHCQPAIAVADEIIFNEGDASHHLYILLSGKINIITQKKGIIHIVNKNESFGEIGLITQRTRSATAQCTEESKLLCINHVGFNTLLGTHPRISAILMRNITASLSQHIIRMNHQQLEHIPGTPIESTADEAPSLVLNNEAFHRK